MSTGWRQEVDELALDGCKKTRTHRGLTYCTAEVKLALCHRSAEKCHVRHTGQHAARDAFGHAEGCTWYAQHFACSNRASPRLSYPGGGVLTGWLLDSSSRTCDQRETGAFNDTLCQTSLAQAERRIRTETSSPVKKGVREQSFCVRTTSRSSQAKLWSE